MSEWKEVKLGDICTELSDGLHKAPLFVEGGDYIFVNAKNLCDGVIVDNDPTKKTTHEEYLKYSKPLNENTILFSIDGTIGNIARYKGEKCVLGKGACYINPNPVHVDSSYIYFQLQSPHFNSYLNCMSTGSTIKHISLKTMRNYEFTLPPLSEQRSIASILSALDDKIAVNRRICENLEAQAQALFKHWFIDFAPFLDKPSGKAERKNGKFVESELGMIPEGWRVGKAEDFYSINIGKTPPRAERQWFSESRGNNKIWISISDMGGCGAFISDSKEYLTPEAQSKFNIVMVPAGTVLLSFKLTLGRVAIADAELTTNEAIARFILPCSDYREYTYLYLKQFKYGRLGSTSSIATAVNSKIIKAMPFLMPPKEVIMDFSNIAGKLFDEIKNLNQESARLSTLRDTLLPKLMSGQIKV